MPESSTSNFLLTTGRKSSFTWATRRSREGIPPQSILPVELSMGNTTLEARYSKSRMSTCSETISLFRQDTDLPMPDLDCGLKQTKTCSMFAGMIGIMISTMIPLGISATVPISFAGDLTSLVFFSQSTTTTIFSAALMKSKLV